MAKIYFRKIRAGELNINTGEPWCIDDVPARWKAAVQKLLDEAGSGGVWSVCTSERHNQLKLTSAN